MTHDKLTNVIDPNVLVDILSGPVRNKCIMMGEELEVMLVGGPNQRVDFHVNPTEEFFYQIRGPLHLSVIDCDGQSNGDRRQITVNEGNCFLLPANVPHCPKRPDGTLGIVVERVRPAGMLDHCIWLCRDCNLIIKDVAFQCTNLETDIKAAITNAGSVPIRCPDCAHNIIKQELN